MKEISPGKYLTSNGNLIVDQEYIEAYEKGKEEKDTVYKVTYIHLSGQMCHFLKVYKPSIATLFAKRTGHIYTPIKEN